MASSVPLEGIVTDLNVVEDPNRLKKSRQSRVAVLARLRAWHTWDEDRRKSPRNLLLSQLGIHKQPPCPDDDELISLALHFFPDRAKLSAVVCDYGDDRFERSECKMSEIASAMESKADWATVRWIHIPVGPGPLASDLKNLFLNGHPRCTYPVGRFDPYLQVEVLNLRDRQHLQDQIDVFNILKEFTKVTRKLRRQNLQRKSTAGSRSFGVQEERFSFWDHARSDLPLLLTEGNFGISGSSILSPSLAVEDQMLSRHPNYKGVILVRDLFQSFHRGDGFLLTMSSMVGINYINKDLLRKLKPTNVFDARRDDQHGVLEFLRMCWSPEFRNRYGGRFRGDARCGTSSWDLRSVEWLLISIMAELEVTPKKLGQGNYPDIQTAYISLVRDLKRRRALPLKRYESIELVRGYATCMNEISYLHEASEQEVKNLKALSEYWSAIENQTHSEPRDVVIEGKPERSLSETLQQNINLIQSNNEALPRLLTDLKSSLDV
ncbi:MAG: hypothetical protein Q9224_006643, partial [Gallowayella concinna]